jgi:hypothetical protein
VLSCIGCQPARTVHRCFQSPDKKLRCCFVECTPGFASYSLGDCHIEVRDAANDVVYEERFAGLYDMFDDIEDDRGEFVWENRGKWLSGDGYAQLESLQQAQK